jgi:hypothetical protein
MNGYDAQIQELDIKLYRLYRSGSRDQDKIDGLWARLELLEATKARVDAGVA